MYVGDLLGSVRKDEITREFKKFGELKDVWVARNPPGFAFVEFTKAVDAERAVRALDGMNVCGSRIRVEFARVSTSAKTRKPVNSVGGGTPGGNGPRRSISPVLGPRGALGGGMRRPRTPPFSPPRRGPMSPPPRGRSPFRRGRTPPPPPPPAPGRGYHPYDALPPMYHPDPAFPYLPGYPMMPFIPPEELLRTLQRGRSPLGPIPPRGRSPPSRRRYASMPTSSHRSYRLVLAH